jgi:hypothetical protein
MNTNLGEMLIEAGKITAVQLDEALKCQVIFGGRLGTNLIELGYLEERDLTDVLSKKTRVPAADPDKLMNLTPDLISVIPRDIAEKYKVVPYSIDKKRLNLVMADPLNLAALDEISFRTGFIVIPLIAPEVRIFHALEKYYEIRREMRYIRVSKEISQGRQPHKTESATEKPAVKRVITESAVPHQHATPEMSSLEVELLELAEDFEGFHKIPETPSAEPTATLGSPATAVSLKAPSVKEGEPYTLEAFALDLAESRDREGIADVLVKYLGQEFTRCALFIVKGTKATGWRSIVKRRPIEDFDAFQIDFNEPSTLKLVAEGKSFYLGPIPETVNNRLMLAAMASGNLPTALLVPLLMSGRVVAVLYVDGEQTTLGERLPELQKIMTKASLAFEILILRTKILA